MPPTHHRQLGQATIEYAGLLAVLAAVLVLAGAVTNGGAITNGVIGGIRRALCVVTGGRCEVRPLAACTVGRRVTGSELGVKVTFVALGKDLTLTREEKSDGTVDLTLIDGSAAGVTAALGMTTTVTTGASGLSKGTTRTEQHDLAEAELMARLGRSSTWHLPDGAAADRLTKTLVKRVAADKVGDVASTAPPIRVLRGIAHKAGFDGDELPAADEDGLEVGIAGAAKAGITGLASAELGLGHSLGGSRNRRTGELTFVLGMTNEVGAALTTAAGGGEFSGAGEAAAQLKLDRHGDPLELVVGFAASGGGSFQLGEENAEHGRSGRVEASVSLDLTVPENRAAFDRFAHGLTPRGVRDLPGAIAGLGDRLRSAGTGDVARYSVGERTYGAEVEAALGARVGVSAAVTRSTNELQDAWTRPPGGVWEQRTDCLKRA